MGHGVYTDEAYRRITVTKGYHGKSRSQIFESRDLDPAMDPSQVDFRESRDSVDHPNSVPIVVALDVTGSMGFVPELIVKETLPKLVGAIISAGIPDPQILFLGIGDHVYDSAPLQVGQFESSAELLDRWLTKVYLEGGGGGNNCESYSLAYLFAARHTRTDHWEKRNKKGFVFTIGDEPCAKEIPGEIISRLTTGKNKPSVSTGELIKEASERYHVFHLHLEHDAISKTEGRKQGWRELLGENLIILQDHTLVASTIASLVINNVSSGETETQHVEDML